MRGAAEPEWNFREAQSSAPEWNFREGVVSCAPTY